MFRLWNDAYDANRIAINAAFAAGGPIIPGRIAQYALEATLKNRTPRPAPGAAIGAAVPLEPPFLGLPITSNALRTDHIANIIAGILAMAPIAFLRPVDPIYAPAGLGALNPIDLGNCSIMYYLEAALAGIFAADGTLDNGKSVSIGFSHTVGEKWTAPPTSFMALWAVFGLLLGERGSARTIFDSSLRRLAKYVHLTLHTRGFINGTRGILFNTIATASSTVALLKFLGFTIGVARGNKIPGIVYRNYLINNATVMECRWFLAALCFGDGCAVSHWSFRASLAANPFFNVPGAPLQNPAGKIPDAAFGALLPLHQAASLRLVRLTQAEPNRALLSFASQLARKIGLHVSSVFLSRQAGLQNINGINRMCKGQYTINH